MVASDADPQLNTGLTPGIKTSPEELSLTKIKSIVNKSSYRLLQTHPSLQSQSIILYDYCLGTEVPRLSAGVRMWSGKRAQ